MKDMCRTQQYKHFYTQQITKVMKKRYKRLSLMIRSVMKQSLSIQSSSNIQKIVL